MSTKKTKWVFQVRIESYGSKQHRTLRGRVYCRFQLALLSIDNRQHSHKQWCETKISTTTKSNERWKYLEGHCTCQPAFKMWCRTTPTISECCDYTAVVSCIFHFAGQVIRMEHIMECATETIICGHINLCSVSKFASNTPVNICSDL